MGTESCIFIGPYLLIERKKVTVKYTIKGCLSCKKEIYSKFCSNCGSEQAEYTEEKKELVNHWDYTEKIKEKLWNPGSNCWDGKDKRMVLVSNVKITGITRKFSINTDDSLGIFPINNDTIQDEIEKFSKFFEKEIEIAREMLDENCKVHWGVISYYS